MVNIQRFKIMIYQCMISLETDFWRLDIILFKFLYSGSIYPHLSNNLAETSVKPSI